MSSSPDSSPEMRSKIKIYTKTGDKGTTQLYNMDRLPKNVDFFEALGNTDEANSTLGLAREYFLHIPAVQKIKKNEQNDEKNEKNEKRQDIIDVDGQLAIIQSRLLDLGSWYVFKSYYMHFFSPYWPLLCYNSQYFCPLCSFSLIFTHFPSPSIATPITTSPNNRLTRVEFDPTHITQLEEWIDEFDSKLPALTVFILPSGGLTASTLHVARTITRRAERSVIGLWERGDVDIAVMQYLNRLSDYCFQCARYCSMIEGKEEVTYKKATPRQLAKIEKEKDEQKE